MKLFLFTLIYLNFGIVEAGRLRRGVEVTVREETCRFCFRQCPINCFVGSCGLESGFTTKRYKFTEKCWTCDLQASLGINQNGDFELCTTKEAAVTSPYVAKMPDTGPTGPSEPGDARAAAQAAADAATKASAAAQLAADKAKEVIAAVKSKATATLLASQGGSSNSHKKDLDAEQKAIATQLEAQEKLKAAEAATAARNVAEQAYNEQLKELRKQQLVTNRAEEILMRAEKAAKDADMSKTQAVENADQANRDAAMLGAEAAGQAAEKAEADELASAARAAQRRAIAAAKEAKDAADKVNVAANIAATPDHPLPTLPPCDPNVALLQTKGKQPQGCTLPQGGTNPETLMAQDQMVEKLAGLPSGALTAQEPVPEFLRQMLQQSGDSVSQVESSKQSPSVYDLSPPQSQLAFAVNGEGADSASAQVSQDNDANDFLPGMLSTIQMGSRMHDWGHGTSKIL